MVEGISADDLIIALYTTIRPILRQLLTNILKSECKDIMVPLWYSTADCNADILVFIVSNAASTVVSLYDTFSASQVVSGALVINALGIAACCAGVSAFHWLHVYSSGESSTIVLPLVESSVAFNPPVNCNVSLCSRSVPAAFSITWPPSAELPPPRR